MSEEQIEEIEERYWRGAGDDEDGDDVRPTKTLSSGYAERYGAKASGAGGARDAKKRFGQHFLEPAWVDKVFAPSIRSRRHVSSRLGLAVAR